MEPPEWLRTLLNDFNKNRRANGAEPQDMHAIVQALKGCSVHVLIENSRRPSTPTGS